MEFQSDGPANVGDIEREGYLTSVVTTVDGWRVRSHWFYADGEAIPAALDIEFHSVPETFRQDGVNTWFEPGSERPRELKRDIVDSLRVGAVLREHRRAAWQAMVTEAGDASSGFHAWAAEQAAHVAKPATRPQPSESHYRKVAELYKRAPDKRRASRWVFEELIRELYTFTRKGEEVSPSPDRVRQWIAGARARGYLPPAASKRSNERKTSE